MANKILAASILVSAVLFLNATNPRAEAAQFSYQKSFKSYAEGSDASPDWTTSTMGWEISKGNMVATDAARSFAWPVSPVGSKLSFESKIIIHEKNTASWKTSGIALHRTDKNYWFLLLGESPDDKGKRHFVEFSEMYGGVWQSDKGKLAIKENVGGSFAWEYNHPYILSISLTPEMIEGTVKESDGTVRAHISYLFNKTIQSVTFGRGSLASGGFKTSYIDFSARVEKSVADRELDDSVITKYFSKKSFGQKQKGSGFFRTTFIEGRWWLVDPLGNLFLAIGVDGADYNSPWCESLGYSPYHRNIEKKYVNADNWAAAVLSRLDSWGFTNLGVNCHPSLTHRGFPHMENLKLGMEFASYDGITPRTTWTGFPDVFSPKFERFCDKRALQLCDPVKKDPWIIGYFIDNELEWYRKTGNGLFADTLAKEKDYPAKVVLLDMIRKRHASIDSFNRAWKTSFKNFDDLKSAVTVPNKIGTPEAQGDEDEYLALVAEKYFSVTTRLIRKYDPNHLILGCRFAGRAPDRVWAAAGKYCDVVSVNCYRKLDLATGVPADRFDSEIDQWFTIAKRPMMVTEWAFPALDSGLPCKHGAGQRVPTQKDRSFLSESFQKLLFSKSYVVGSDMFKWVDQPALGVSSTFPEDSNYGLVDVNDSPYEELVNMFTRINKTMYERHLKSGK